MTLNFEWAEFGLAGAWLASLPYLALTFFNIEYFFLLLQYDYRILLTSSRVMKYLAISNFNIPYCLHTISVHQNVFCGLSHQVASVNFKNMETSQNTESKVSWVCLSAKVRTLIFCHYNEDSIDWTPDCQTSVSHSHDIPITSCMLFIFVASAEYQDCPIHLGSKFMYWLTNHWACILPYGRKRKWYAMYILASVLEEFWLTEPSKA